MPGAMLKLQFDWHISSAAGDQNKLSGVPNYPASNLLQLKSELSENLDYVRLSFVTLLSSFDVQLFDASQLTSWINGLLYHNTQI